MRTLTREIRRIQTLRTDELMVAAKDLRAPFELVIASA